MFVVINQASQTTMRVTLLSCESQCDSQWINMKSSLVKLIKIKMCNYELFSTRHKFKQFKWLEDQTGSCIHDNSIWLTRWAAGTRSVCAKVDSCDARCTVQFTVARVPSAVCATHLLLTVGVAVMNSRRAVVGVGTDAASWKRVARWRGGPLGSTHSTSAAKDTETRIFGNQTND